MVVLKISVLIKRAIFKMAAQTTTCNDDICFHSTSQKIKDPHPREQVPESSEGNRSQMLHICPGSHATVIGLNIGHVDALITVGVALGKEMPRGKAFLV